MKQEQSAYSVKSYLSGFSLCLVLTVVAFLSISFLGSDVSKTVKMMLIAALALLQILIQLLFFLHLKDASDHWNLAALVFTVIVIFTIVGGSSWIIYNLNMNMMVH